MEDRNFEKALEIFSLLITGSEISRDDKETKELYEEYTNNSQVFDIISKLCANLNLIVYEYEYSLYVSPGHQNRVFGFTNEELKREIGVRLNRELYLCYFIIYVIVTKFYKDTGTKTFAEYVKAEDVIQSVDTALNSITSKLDVLELNEEEEHSFKTIAVVWEDLPMMQNQEASVRAARGSKFGFVKIVFNFLVKQDLLIDNEGRYYPKKRMRALVEHYFEEYKGRLCEIMKGDSTDATY